MHFLKLTYLLKITHVQNFTAPRAKLKLWYFLLAVGPNLVNLEHACAHARVFEPHSITDHTYHILHKIH